MNKTYRALIVDDERLARKDLANLLQAHRNIQIAGEAEDVPSAAEAIQRLQPDLVFLDIQMPGQTGFDLLDAVAFHGRIIFVTAYDEFALRAFEVNALDYLLKPVHPERLARALEKLEQEPVAAKSGWRPLTDEDRLFLQIGSRFHFVKVAAIIAIQSAGDYSHLYEAGGLAGLTGKTMREWEERLPSRLFCRIHRTAIINMDQVERIEEWFNFSYRVYVKGLPEPLMISRRYATRLKERLS